MLVNVRSLIKLNPFDTSKSCIGKVLERKLNTRLR